MKRDDQEILKEVQKNSRMAIKAIDTIMDKVSNDEEWKAYYECIKAVNMKNANFSVVYLRLQMNFIGPNLKE